MLLMKHYGYLMLFIKLIFNWNKKASNSKINFITINFTTNSIVT